MLLVDLSSNQGSVDFAVLRRHVAGVYHKASEGRGWNDPLFAERRAQARKNKLPFGAYHFARPDLHPSEGGAKVEADHFCKLVGRFHPGDLRPTLDLEVGWPSFEWAKAFSQQVHKRLGVYPLFYSYPVFIARMKLPRPVGAGLWLASYGSNDGREHTYLVPKPWKKVVLHQFTSEGKIPGVSGRVDLSHATSLKPLAVLPFP